MVVTLRGERMYELLDRLVSNALARVREWSETWLKDDDGDLSFPRAFPR